MNIELCLRIIRAARCANVPVFMWGGPGTGKSDAVEKIAELNDEPFEVLIGSHADPSDVNGLPFRRDDGTTGYATPSWAKRLIDAGRGIAFNDELTTASPAVQAAMLRYLRSGHIGEEQLPDTVYRLAAGNEAHDAADGWELAPPVANRFLHMDWTGASPEQWGRALTTSWDDVYNSLNLTVVTNPDADRVALKRSQVRSFVSVQPGLLHAQPKDPSQAGKAWPSRRTWAYFADILPHFQDDDLDAIQEAASGLLGEGAAVQFLTWLRHYDLPHPSDVLSDPSSVDWSGESTDRVFAMMAAVTSYAAADDTSNKVKVERFTQAFEVLATCAAAGKGDVGSVFVTDLMMSRPPAAEIPSNVMKTFSKTMKLAGIGKVA